MVWCRSHKKLYKSYQVSVVVLLSFISLLYISLNVDYIFEDWDICFMWVGWSCWD